MTSAGPVARAVEVGVALLWRDGRLLVDRRRADDTFAGRWEFPGGKVRDGETPAQATVRECREELGVDVRVLGPARTLEHDASGKRVRLHFFWCSLAAGEPLPLRSAELAWAAPAELPSFPFLPADAPLVTDLAAGRLTPGANHAD